MGSLRSLASERMMMPFMSVSIGYHKHSKTWKCWVAACCPGVSSPAISLGSSHAPRFFDLVRWTAGPRDVSAYVCLHLEKRVLERAKYIRFERQELFYCPHPVLVSPSPGELGSISPSPYFIVRQNSWSGLRSECNTFVELMFQCL